MLEFIWFALSPKQRKLVIWSVILLAGYTVIGFLILPPIIRSVTASQLHQQLDRDVSIRQVKLNPFTFSATIRGFLIQDKDGQPFVSWDEVYVNFQPTSFFGRAWRFKEINVIKPFVHAQVNQDGTFNFSDLIAKFAPPGSEEATNTPSRPLALRIDRLHIAGAKAKMSDLTTREPFNRVIGPVVLSLKNFRTDRDHKNPFSLAGSTDAGETFAWSGGFYLNPLRSSGEISVSRLALNKFAPLYQDFVRFEIRDGNVGLHANYQFELSDTNHLVAITNTAFALRDFRLGEPGDTNDIIDLAAAGAADVNANLEGRRAAIGSVYVTGANLNLQRPKNQEFNLVEISKPAETTANPPGGVLFLLHSVTNLVATLLESTNQWHANIAGVNVTNNNLRLEDFASSRAARLDLNDLALSVKNISNDPTTNLTAALSLRWNTNGTIHTEVSASFAPPTAEIAFGLTNLDLGTLDPYLEPLVNLLILDSKIGLTGQIHLRTPENQLPEITFQGDARLDDFRTVDGVLGEDLLKWSSLRITGIDANLNPQTVSVKEIALDNAYAKVVIETNKTINLLAALQPAKTNTSTGPRMDAFASKAAVLTTNNLNLATPPKISVGSIVVSNAAFHFTDRSLTPNVNLGIQQAGGEISGISSEQLQHADVNLHALVDNIGPADITGHFNPFSPTSTNDFTISVKDVDLTPTGPYSGKYSGYRIARGKLNMDLQYEIVGKKIESRNVITLDQFTFGEKVNSPDATHLPVKLAIALLKDREGKIVLDVPIEGNLDDPQFRVSKVFTRAILNILTKVATSPFSLLGAVFGGGGEELSYQDFAPGSAELSPDDTKKLDALAKALYERPALQLEIAGSVDPPDDRDGLQRLALDKQLRTRQWQSLGKAERGATTPEQIVLSPEDRASLVKKLYGEAQAAGKITPEILAANTNVAAAVAQISSRRTERKRGAALLMQTTTVTTVAPDASNTSTNAMPAKASKLAPPDDPMEVLLLATIPVSDSDLEALATNRAKAVRAYLLQTGKVDADRLFLTENQAGGVRSDGSRVYLQFQ
jgi:hypothetical protein